MAPGLNDPIFYTVLVAPGFIAVMTAISLASVEGDVPPFVILVWSLVSSLIVDTIFLWLYQWLYRPITSLEALTGMFFQPYFRSDLILGILAGSFGLGLLYTAGILGNFPERLRRLLQRKARIRYNPRQPWENFMKKAGTVRVKTSDNQLYFGRVVEWSRANKPKELWIDNLSRYNEKLDELEPVGGDDITGDGSQMVFLENDIERVLMWHPSAARSFWRRWWQNRFWSSSKTDRDLEGS